MIESTAVEDIGRITHNCTGIYNDDCLTSIRTVLEKVKALSLNKVKFGIQLGHAGRKASTQRPWEGRSFLRDNQNPWKTIAPSAIPFDEGWPIPKEIMKMIYKGLKQLLLMQQKEVLKLDLI